MALTDRGAPALSRLAFPQHEHRTDAGKQPGRFAPELAADRLRLCDEVDQLRAENERLREAAGQARLALAGYVSPRSAVDKLDSALAAMAGR